MFGVSPKPTPLTPEASSALELGLVYGCDLARLPTHLQSRFVALGPDDALRRFLAQLPTARHGRWLTRFHRMLRNVASDFDVNGLLKMYSMHLLSTEQWSHLLGSEPIEMALDIGAGSGDVTQTLAPLCGQLSTTEVSRIMAFRLRRRGFVCRRLDIAQGGLESQHYDLITCLNVLDRCRQPRTLLRSLIAALKPGGRLVTALVLPYDPFYYDGPTTPEPLEQLRCPAKGWEEAAAQFIESELTPLGVELNAWSRVPYLSCGDAERDIYVLDALITVSRPFQIRD